MARLVGTVEGEPGALVFADATLAVGGKKHVERREGPGQFVLRLASGRTVEVQGVVAARRDGRVRLEGPYGELVSHPIARLFDAKAPGDHVRAEIVGFGLFAGDTVTVVGEVIEERSRSDEPARDEGSLREAPRREPSVIRAERLVLGREETEPPRTAPAPAPRSLEARHPLETSSRVSLGLGLTMLAAGLALSYLAPVVPERAWLTPVVGVGLALALVGFHRLDRGRWHASYVTIVGGKRVTPWEPILGYVLEPWLVGFGYVSWAWLCAVEPSPSAVTVCLAAPALLALAHLVLVAMQEAPFRRFATLVLGLPPHTPERATSGRMVLLEGRVSSTGTVARRRVEHLPKLETRHSTDDRGNTRTSTSTVLRDREHTSVEGFEVELAGEGEAPMLAVRPSEARIALAHRRPVPHASLAIYEETLSHGEPVCIGARLDREGDVRVARARGEESLFVWAGSRAELVRALWRARLRLALGGALVLVPLLLAQYLFPFAARFHATGTVTSSSGGVPVGETCEVRVIAYHYGLEPRCSMRLSCGGASLYGGFEMGQMDCVFSRSPLGTSIAGSDTDAYDGDPAVAFSFVDGTLSYTDEGGQSFVARLDPAAPAAWW